MPTILLQEIRDLLTSFLTAINAKIESMLEKLEKLDDIDAKLAEIDENVEDISTDTQAITSLTSNINNTTLSIDSNVETITDNSTDIKDTLHVIDLTTSNTYNKINSIDSNVDEINARVGAIVTPITRINENISSIKANSDTILVNSRYLPQIASNTGDTAAFAEDTATNTRAILDKVTTISEDTTQMRADNQNIINILTAIYRHLEGGN